jgi:prepilin-type N-terminal cleavage/methylation domain-containing protein
MRRRTGFTLVEVLVAMALILFIMTILAAAFGAATQAVSDLKAAGDLAERLRGAATVLKRDVEADHCFDANGNVLPLRFPWDTTISMASPPPPTAGFFRIYQGAPDTLEGVDGDGLPSYRQTTTSLHYTISLHGPLRGDFLSAAVPGASPLLTDPALLLQYPPDERYQDTAGVYNSPSAEAALFLVPTVDVTDSSAPGGAQQLYALYRRQLLTAPPIPPRGKQLTRYTPPAPVPANQAAAYPEVSVIPDAGEASAAANLSFNSLLDLTMPVRRFWMNRGMASGLYQAAPSPPAPAGTYRFATMGECNAAYQAADLLMPDVLSFDVRVLVAGSSEFEDLFQITNPNRPGGVYYPWNNQYIYDPATTTPARAFDTWSFAVDPSNPANNNYSTWNTPGSPASIPIYNDNLGHPINIQAIQITLRVWDFKTKKTRQVTIVQQT